MSNDFHTFSAKDITYNVGFRHVHAGIYIHFGLNYCFNIVIINVFMLHLSFDELLSVLFHLLALP